MITKLNQKKMIEYSPRSYLRGQGDSSSWMNGKEMSKGLVEYQYDKRDSVWAGGAKGYYYWLDAVEQKKGLGEESNDPVIMMIQ